MSNELNKLEIATEVKCNPHKFFKMIKYTLHHLPTYFPEAFKSTEVLEGDGESVGSIRPWKYILPGESNILIAKEKINVVDDENMWLILDLFEGDVANEYGTFVLKIHVIPMENGCLVKWSIEYGKKAEGVSDPHHYLNFYAEINDKLAASLLAKEQTE